MNTRPLTDADLLILADWFADRAWPLPPVPHGMSSYGFVCENGGELLACAYLYLTSTGYAFIDWTATNPGLPTELTSEALKAVIATIEDACRHTSDPPIACLVMNTRSEALAQSLKALGFRSKGGFIQCTKMVTNEG